jgi:AraC family transcriptional regulator
MKKYFLMIAVAWACTGNLKAQQVARNLGFENVDASGNVLSWEIGNTKKKYIVRLDTAVAHSGKCSFVIEMGDDIADRGFAGASTLIMGSNIGSKRILRISAFIKTENLTDGIVGIGMQLNGANGPLKEINSNAQSKPGTENWKKHIIELPITTDVQFVRVGLQMTGKGKVWFDDFNITFDDVPIGNGISIP